jgi:hypothetical protein
MDHGLRPVHGGPAWLHGRETAGEQPGWCSSLPVLADNGRDGEGRCGGLATELIGARGAVEPPGD